MTEPENAFSKHRALGEHYLSAGLPTRAIEQFRAALSLEPGDAHAHALMALALLGSNRLEAAAHEADLALQIAPNTPFYFYVRGVVWGGASRWKEAQGCLQTAIELDPDEPAFHTRLAGIFQAQDKPKLAEKSAREALELDPDQADAHLFLSQALLDQGRKDDALHHARRAVELEPQDTQAHSCLGVCLLRLNNTEGALQHISEALRLDPQNASARHNLVLAMGAKNLFYGLLWRWNLMLARLPGAGRIAVVLGLWATMQGLDLVANQRPAWRPAVEIVSWIYIAFCAYTWFAPLIFKTWLRRRGAI